LKELGKLSNQDEETAIKIIGQSIANGWKGLFELKENTNGDRKSRHDKAFEQVARAHGFGN